MRPQTSKERKYHHYWSIVTILFLAVFKILKTPGPGTYVPVDGININGQYAMSGHMRTKAPSMRLNTKSQTKYDRVPTADIYQPGPGWYDHRPQSMST